MRLQQQLASRDDTITALMSEKLRLGQQLALVPDERRAWTDRTAALQAEVEKKVGGVRVGRGGGKRGSGEGGRGNG